MIHLCSEAGGGCGCRIPSPKVGTHIEMAIGGAYGLWHPSMGLGENVRILQLSSTIINYPKVVGGKVDSPVELLGVRHLELFSSAKPSAGCNCMVV